MTDILAKIEITKRAEIAAARATVPEREIKARAAEAPPVRGFARSLGATVGRGRYALIAEIKKASPSKGLIRADFDPPKLARAYEEGGATCLSILTDELYFQGHPDYLKAARDATTLPTLRKDFMFEAYQVYEARAWGADAILIILAAVSDEIAAKLEETAISLCMDVILEVHNKTELDRALHLTSPLIGINNRSLRTFETALSITETLAPNVPDDRVIICESGLYVRQDLDRMSDCGVHTFLVGESLMRHENVCEATRALVGAPCGDSANQVAV